MLLFQPNTGILFFFFLYLADVGKISLTRSSGDGGQQLLNPEWQKGGGGGRGGSSRQVDGVVGGSLNWFGAWQAPVSHWLPASTVVRVIYSNHRVCSPRRPTQAPWFVLSQNSGLEGDFPDK